MGAVSFVLLAGATAAALLLGHYAGFSSWPDLLSGGKGTNAGSASLASGNGEAGSHGGTTFLNLGQGGLPFATGTPGAAPFPLPGVAPAGPGLLITNSGGGGPGGGNGGGNGGNGANAGGAATGPGAGGPSGPEGPVIPPQPPPPGGSTGTPQNPGMTPGETNPPPTESPGSGGDQGGGGNDENEGSGCGGSVSSQAQTEDPAPLDPAPAAPQAPDDPEASGQESSDTESADSEPADLHPAPETDAYTAPAAPDSSTALPGAGD